MTLDVVVELVDDRMSSSFRERTVSESPLRPWKKEVAAAGGAQRRAYVGDRKLCRPHSNTIQAKQFADKNKSNFHRTVNVRYCD